MNTKKQPVAVIGAGPGGYVAAIKLAQQGLNVVLVDASGGLGGTCLQWGCIPTKALLEWSHQVAMWREGHWPGLQAAVNLPEAWPKALAWKQSLITTLQGGIKALLKKHKVQVLAGKASFVQNAERLTLTLGAVEASSADLPASLQPATVVLATGGTAVSLPQLPIDGVRVWSVEQALSSETLPEHLAILGGGVIGLEIATLYSQVGVAVTVLEGLPELLPGWQPEAVAVVKKALLAKGVRFELGSCLSTASVSTASVSTEAVSLTLENGTTVQASHVLVAVGRKPNTHALNLAAVGVNTNEQGAVVVDAQCRTSNPAVFAIGDCTPGAQLAHRASYEAAIIAKVLGGEATAVCDWAALPQVVYTQPALAQVGWPWAEVEAAKVELKVGQFPWKSLGKAHVLGSTQGHVVLVAEANTNKLVHATMVGSEADNQIGALALALELGATLEDVAATIQPHPSLMEAWPEAAELALHGFSTHG